MAADAWELRTARLEGAYEQIDRRLGAVEGRLSTLEYKMDTGFAELRVELRGEIGSLRSEMLGRMDRQFYWLLGAFAASGLLQLGLRFTGH